MYPVYPVHPVSEVGVWGKISNYGLIKNSLEAGEGDEYKAWMNEQALNFNWLLWGDSTEYFYTEY